MLRTAGWARTCPLDPPAMFWAPDWLRFLGCGGGALRALHAFLCHSNPSSFAAAAQQRGGVVLQISHGVDPIGAGTEPVLHMSGEGRQNSAWPPAPGGTGRTDRGTAMDITSPSSMDPSWEDYSGDGIFFVPISRAAGQSRKQSRTGMPSRRSSFPLSGPIKTL